MGGYTPVKTAPYLSNIVNWLATFHTYAFVFASGYLFSYGRYTKHKYRAPSTDIKNRIARLLLPYAVIALIWAIPADILFTGLSVKVALKNYIFVLSSAQLWFLVMLFTVWMFFYLVSDKVLKLPLWGGITGFIVIRVLCVFLEQSHIPIGVFCVSNSMRYALLFYLGMVFEFKHFTFKRPKLSCLFFLVVEIPIYYLYRHYIGLPIHNVYIEEAIFLLTNVNGVLLSWALVNCFDSKKIVGQKWFVSISQCSMGIYLLHQQVLYASMRLLSASWIPPLLFVTLNFIFAVVVSFVIVYLARKTKIGRVVLGG